MKKQDYFLISVEFAEMVVREKWTNLFKLYLYLKWYSKSGKIKLKDKTIYQNRPKGLKDRETFRKNLKQLISLNWVGYNPKSGYLFIRGFNFLNSQHGVKSKSAVLFYYEENINYLQVFLFAAVVGHKAIWQVSRKRFGRKKGRSKQNRRSPAFLYAQHYNGFLADIFQLDKARIRRLKKKAKELGYLNFRHVFDDSTKIHIKNSKELKTLKIHYPEIGKRVRYIDEKLVIQQADSFESLLHFRRRRKR